MKTLLTLLLAYCCSVSLASPGEEDMKNNFLPIVTVVKQPLGNKIVTIKTYRYGSRKDVVMINLHSNENASLLAALQWLKTNGGLLIKIENGDERYLTFQIDTASFIIDPNHIFSAAGIKIDFENNKHHVTKAIAEAQSLAKKILSLIPQNPTLVVALHNNFNGGFGIDDYLPKHERSRDAALTNRNQALDGDDFFLTTDPKLYKQLEANGYNIVLQKLKTVKRDGSLSVYFHEKNMAYLNCETEHGKQSTYLQMLTKALSYIERRNNNERLLAYRCSDSLGLLQKGISIYKDSNYIGEIKSCYRLKDSVSVTGKFSLPIKMKASENLELQAKTDENGKTILNLKTMTGSAIKSDKQKVTLNIYIAVMAEPAPFEEPLDSSLQNKSAFSF